MAARLRSSQTGLPIARPCVERGTQGQIETLLEEHPGLASVWCSVRSQATSSRDCQRCLEGVQPYGPTSRRRSAMERPDKLEPSDWEQRPAAEVASRTEPGIKLLCTIFTGTGRSDRAKQHRRSAPGEFGTARIVGLRPSTSVIAAESVPDDPKRSGRARTHAADGAENPRQTCVLGVDAVRASKRLHPERSVATLAVCGGTLSRCSSEASRLESGQRRRCLSSPPASTCRAPASRSDFS